MKNYIYTSDILLPDFEKVDGTKWATIACDQFTSEQDYWQSAEEAVGESPSALRLILPEIYLNDNKAERVEKINAAMEQYEKTVLTLHRDCMIYLERTDSQGNLRRGIVASIDLEDYDYTVGTRPLIRATEGTVLERIPPRAEVRKNALLELPHVMLLIDDKGGSVIEKTAEKKEDFACAYDFPLMLGGGHVRGYFMSGEAIESVKTAIAELAGEKEDVLLFAVGDGNHSLATAKAHYEQIKKSSPDTAKDSPARFALCEIVNIHDSSLEFEPIYRVLFNVDAQALSDELCAYASLVSKEKENEVYPAQTLHCICKEKEFDVTFEHGTHSLTVGTLQKFLDDFVKSHPECELDYIHGTDSLRTLACRDNSIGFIFDGMQKSELFPAVECDGALPRKTFSMGEARDKRYYIESRKIR